MFYLIIEHFKNGDAKPVYRRFRDGGRLAPDSLTYVSSWIDETMQRCFQLMETDYSKHIDEWISNWNDIIDF